MVHISPVSLSFLFGKTKQKYFPRFYAFSFLCSFQMYSKNLLLFFAWINWKFCVRLIQHSALFSDGHFKRITRAHEKQKLPRKKWNPNFLLFLCLLFQCNEKLCEAYGRDIVSELRSKTKKKRRRKFSQWKWPSLSSSHVIDFISSFSSLFCSVFSSTSSVRIFVSFYSLSLSHVFARIIYWNCFVLVGRVVTDDSIFSSSARRRKAFTWKIIVA